MIEKKKKHVLTKYPIKRNTKTSIFIHILLEDIIFILFFFLFLLTAIDTAAGSDDTLERLRNITKMFTAKEDETPQLKKVEKFAPGDKIQKTFQK